MTMSILRELFGNYLETCALLGVTDDITERCGRRVSLTLSGGALAECEIEGSRPLRILFAGEDVTDRFTYDGKRCCLQAEA